jgi:ABC-type branched-subunit amino acid transport system ATPase component
MIEQNIGALSVADVGLVMEQGTIIAEVRGEELEDPSQLREIFLG